MKKKLKTSILVAAIAAVFIAGTLVAQNVYEIPGNVIYRVTNPYHRFIGNMDFQDRSGTTRARLVSTGGFSSTRPAIVGTDATKSLATTDCGAVVVATRTSSTQVYTLPAVGTTGCMFTFIAGHADGEILVNAATAVTCVITVFSAVGTDADTAIVTDTTCNTGLKNTAATNAVGDSLTLVSDGTQWLGVGITTGIWTTQ
jgi:hypothetical protein